MAVASRVNFDKHEKPEYNKASNEDGDVAEDDQIKISEVEFSYPSKPDVQILNGVSIEVKRNHIVALVGASGCGKSSIIALVERWYDPSSGKITYNGEDLKNIDNRWYHQNQVSLVQQEPILFNDSIRENIMYGVDTSKMTPEETDKMLKDAC